MEVHLLIAEAASLPYICGQCCDWLINHVGSLLPVSTERLLIETICTCTHKISKTVG